MWAVCGGCESRIPKLSDCLFNLRNNFWFVLLRESLLQFAD